LNLSRCWYKDCLAIKTTLVSSEGGVGWGRGGMSLLAELHCSCMFPFLVELQNVQYKNKSKYIYHSIQPLVCVDIKIYRKYKDSFQV